MTNSNEQVLSCGNKKAIELLKKAQKHLQQVIKMVEEKRYCLDIIQQSRTVQDYLRMADKEILSAHLKISAQKALNKKNTNQQLQEILLIFKKGREYGF